MKTMQRSAAVLALIITPAVFAQTYLVPSGGCGNVTLHVSNHSETIAPDDVTSAHVYAQRRKLTAKLNPEPGGLTFDANVSDAGVVMAAVNLKSKVSGNETETEHAKAMLFCGATPAADWQRSTGLGLEIYPQGWNGPRPHLKAGDPMRFIAVDAATKQIADVPMHLYRAGGDRIAEGTPAPHGGVTFPYPEPGLYVVVTKYRRPDPQQSGHWLVDTSTLSFEVK